MLIRRELRGTGTGCLFQFTYCVHVRYDVDENILQNSVVLAKKNNLVFSSDFEINSGHYIHEERIKTTQKKISVIRFEYLDYRERLHTSYMKQCKCDWIFHCRRLIYFLI